MTNKAILLAADVILQYTDQDVYCRLTQKQAVALYAMAEFLGWSTRWVGNFTTIDIKTFSEDAATRLLEWVDCEGDVDVQAIVDAICASGCIPDAQEIRDIVTEEIAKTQEKEVKDSFWDNAGQKDTFVPEAVTSEEIDIADPATKECDNDISYAAAKNVVQWVDRGVKDFLEQIKAAVNLIDLVVQQFTIASSVADTFPVFNSIQDAIVEATELATQLDNYAADAYDASWTEAVQEELECKLFSFIACNDCKLSYDQLTDVWAEYLIEKGIQLALSGDLRDIFDELADVLAGVGPYASVGAQLAGMLFWRITNNYWGDDKSVNVMAEFRTELKKGIITPNADWVAECNDPECTWEFVWRTGESTAWLTPYISLDQGPFIQASSIGGTFSSGRFREVQVLLPSATAHRLIQMEYTYSVGGEGNPGVPPIVYTTFEGAGRYDWAPPGGLISAPIVGATGSLSYKIIDTDRGLGWDISVNVLSITIRGVGVNPYV